MDSHILGAIKVSLAYVLEVLGPIATATRLSPALAVPWHGQLAILWPGSESPEQTPPGRPPAPVSSPVDARFDFRDFHQASSAIDARQAHGLTAIRSPT
jgi:hypothetical protein